MDLYARSIKVELASGRDCSHHNAFEDDREVVDGCVWGLGKPEAMRTLKGYLSLVESRRLAVMDAS